MDKIVKGAIALIAVAFLGYSGYWFYQANEIEKELSSHVEKLTGENLNGFRFENAGVEKGGFPTDIKVSIKNPKFVNTNNEAQNTVDVDGTLSFGFDMAGNLTYQELKGNSQINIPGDDQNQSDNNLIISGEATLINDGEGPHYKKFLNEFFNPDSPDTQEFWKKFLTQGGQLKIKDFTVQNASDPKNVVTVKNGDITYTRKISDDQQQNIKLYVKLNDVDVKLAQIPINQVNYQNIGDIVNQKVYDKMGTSQVEFEFEGQIPSWEKIQQIIDNPTLLLGSDLRPVNLNIKNFSASNNFGKYNGHLLLSAKEDSNRNFYITGDTEFKTDYSKDYYGALVSIANSLKQDLTSLQPSDDEQQELKKIFVDHSDELKGLIPKFDDIGSVTFTKDGNLTINRNDFSYKLDLKKLDLIARQYGIQIRSNLQGQGANTNGTINFSIANADKLVTDTSNYLNRVFKFINSITPENHLGEITPALQGKIIAYLRKISDDPQSNSKDVNITVALENSTPKIGKLSYQDFLSASGALYVELNNAIGGGNDAQDQAPSVPQPAEAR
jgi:hypothetical protein